MNEADYSSKLLQEFLPEFYKKFADRYIRDKRVAYLQV